MEGGELNAFFRNFIRGYSRRMIDFKFQTFRNIRSGGSGDY